MNPPLKDRAILSAAITLDVTEWFEDTEFQAWLQSSEPKFSTHEPQTPITDDSSVVVLICPSLSGDGNHSDGVGFPAKYWDQLVQLCKDMALYGQYTHIHVRLKCCELDPSAVAFTPPHNSIGEALSVIRDMADRGMEDMREQASYGDYTDQEVTNAERALEAGWVVVERAVATEELSDAA